MTTTTETKTPAPFISPTVRNMIIGITTTVLVSTTVYLLGFNKKNNSTKLQRQKATVEAWKTFTRVENIYAKDLALLLRDATQYGTYHNLYLEFKKESDKFVGTIDGLITTENLDNDMVTMLTRRVENEKASIPPTEKFFDQMDGIVKKAIAEKWDMQQVADTLTIRVTKFQENSKSVMERAIVEIETLAKTLSDRYHETFNVDDFYAVQVYKKQRDIFSVLENDKKQTPITKDFIIGRWDVSGATITLDADGKWTWFVPANNTMSEGTWEWKDGKLLMDVLKQSASTQTGKWRFLLSDATDNSFFMKTDYEPVSSYTLIRKQ
jgi:hypothetical protein